MSRTKLNKNPTDYKILKTLYNDYFDDFIDFDLSNPQRSAKMYVPISFDRLERELGANKSIIFGRLYYHLNKKYSYINDNGSRVDLFLLGLNKEKHLIQFALLSSILANLKDNRRHHLWPIYISAFAVLVSVTSIIFNVN